MTLDGKVSYVLRNLRRQLDEKKKDLAAKKRKTLGAAITYFENNQDHMHYDEYLAAGYPITPQRHLGGSTPFKPD